MPGFMPVLGSASLIYLLMSPRVNKLVYRPLMFFPVSFPDSVTEVPSLEGIVGKEYFFKGKSGQSIHGWHWHNPKAKYTFLFSHGNSGNLTIRLETSRHLLNAGASVFVYDYQGFGKSTGSPSVEGICEDAETAHDFLVRDLGLKESDILLYGESLGAAVSTYLSTVRECSGIVMQSGFSSLKRIAREHFPLLSLYPDLLFPRPPLDSLKVLQSPHPPVLIIHGEQDTVISVDHSQELYEGAVGRKRLLRLPLSSHADVWASAGEECNRALTGFIELVS